MTDAELELIREDILTTPSKPEYPKVLDYFAEYIKPSNPTKPIELREYAIIQWNKNDEPQRIWVKAISGHKCGAPEDFPLMWTDSCGCSRKLKEKTKSRGRFTKD